MSMRSSMANGREEPFAIAEATADLRNSMYRDVSLVMPFSLLEQVLLNTWIDHVNTRYSTKTLQDSD